MDIIEAANNAHERDPKGTMLGLAGVATLFTVAVTGGLALQNGRTEIKQDGETSRECISFLEAQITQGKLTFDNTDALDFDPDAGICRIISAEQIAEQASQKAEQKAANLKAEQRDDCYRILRHHNSINENEAMVHGYTDSGDEVCTLTTDIDHTRRTLELMEPG